MPAQQLDFKKIRAEADFPAVLAHYGITLVKDGQKEHQFKCLCPFHEDSDPSLKVNVERNLFNCYPCGAGGNVLEFVMEMDGVKIRDAARKVQSLSSSEDAPETNAKPKVQKKKKQPADKPKATKQPEIGYNAPLTFTLKNLDSADQWLSKRGITAEMASEFGLGIAQKGMMANRLVFPIHNQQGELVAYCGRFVGDHKTANEPKYKQPPNFRKELELYNWHRVKDVVHKHPTLVLVESFLSTIKLHAWGVPCISPMGRSLSAAQIALLLQAKVKTVILLFDGDDPGVDAAKPVGRALALAGIQCWTPAVTPEFKPHRLPDVADLNHILSPLLR